MTLRYSPLMLALLAAIPVNALAKTQVILNNAWKGAITLDIDNDFPCLTRPLMEEWGVITPLLERLEWDVKGCLTQETMQHFHLQYWYRPQAQLLTLLFPDAALNAQQNGVSTSRWDDGINAFFMNYRLDVNRTNAHYSWDTTGTDANLALESGLNVGAWRLRYQNTLWREKSGEHGSYSNGYSLWRSVRALRSRLTLGDDYTSSNMFDSMAYRGVRLASDQAMFPDRWRPYNPWINGYARSEAEVSISQNGERVYRIHVPPGPFIIRDFYPPDDQGNLELTIQESDGTERTRTLPYSIMPNLMQHNKVDYEVVVGRFKPWHGIEMDKERFWQTTLSWGAWPGLTLFAGFQQGVRYLGQVVGMGGNLGAFGALSMDVSTARYRQNAQNLDGAVWRLRYAKAFLSTETNLTAQLQWYPDGSKYRSLEEKISREAALKSDWDDDTTLRALKGQVEINQNFGEDSSVSLIWERTRGRRYTGNSDSLTLSVNTNWRDVDISLYGGYERARNYPTQTTLGINVSIPFAFGSRVTNVGYLSELASRGESSHGMNIYGSAGEDNNLRYDVTAKHVVHSTDELNASLGWQYNAGQLNVSTTRGGGRRDWHADTSGSVLVHGGGVTLGQTLGSTSALVEVPNTPGVGFYNQFGSTTNREGELLVSYMTPWRVNRVTMDTYALPEEMHFDNDELEAVPTDGAIVRLRFDPPQKEKDKGKDKDKKTDKDDNGDNDGNDDNDDNEE
ncbi:fimbrial biogenesis outer membrane usher protein [Enterobacteriaceae bacterium YMB-R22]|uniref:fimbria/pilus outer membrane usher protein n=1 Tax=Tenebrionicola larvae TaxID=2815733 RepID=UPI00201250C9|nr:fimbria/pilus outer membrane usher protein [Tenebrionicola larvae]MBV4413870.1 fimbrial biogenesis outer membrane usher protein [Tenebrionicola larvae]